MTMDVAISARFNNNCGAPPCGFDWARGSVIDFLIFKVVVKEVLCVRLKVSVRSRIRTHLGVQYNFHVV